MAVVLRLARAGKKKKPYFHVVATDSRTPRDGKHIEIVGAYDPNASPVTIEFNNERLEHWIKVGAKPSDTVASLVSQWQKRPARTQPIASA